MSEGGGGLPKIWTRRFRPELEVDSVPVVGKQVPVISLSNR